VLKEIKYKNSVVSYSRFGSGSDLMIAFHGYGQHAYDFEYFDSVWGGKFTTLSISLFFHDGSYWNEANMLSTSDLSEIISLITISEEVTYKKISFCSFSFGFIPAHICVKLFKESCEYFIILSAPPKEFYYLLKFASKTIIGKRLFSFLKDNRRISLKILKLLRNLTIIGRSQFSFLSIYTESGERLQKVYNTINCYCQLIPDFNSLKNVLDTSDVKTICISGRKDKITPSASMITFVNKLLKKEVFITTDSHKLQSEETSKVISHFLMMQKNVN